MQSTALSPVIVIDLSEIVWTYSGHTCIGLAVP